MRKNDLPPCSKPYVPFDSNIMVRLDETNIPNFVILYGRHEGRLQFVITVLPALAACGFAHAGRMAQEIGRAIGGGGGDPLVGQGGGKIDAIHRIEEEARKLAREIEGRMEAEGVISVVVKAALVDKP